MFACWPHPSTSEQNHLCLLCIPWYLSCNRNSLFIAHNCERVCFVLFILFYVEFIRWFYSLYKFRSCNLTNNWRSFPEFRFIILYLFANNSSGNWVKIDYSFYFDDAILLFHYFLWGANNWKMLIYSSFWQIFWGEAHGSLCCFWFERKNGLCYFWFENKNGVFDVDLKIVDICCYGSWVIWVWCCNPKKLNGNHRKISFWCIQIAFISHSKWFFFSQRTTNERLTQAVLLTSIATPKKLIYPLGHGSDLKKMALSPVASNLFVQ